MMHARALFRDELKEEEEEEKQKGEKGEEMMMRRIMEQLGTRQEQGPARPHHDARATRRALD
jgi:hypothetical protein